MNENLKEALEHYLQGQVNNCVSGLMSRLANMEMKVSNQDHTIETLQRQAAGQQHMIYGYGKQLANLTNPTQPKTRTLNLVALKILAHHGYIGKPFNQLWSNAEADAYDKLISLKLIEGRDGTYSTTNKGDAYLAKLQATPLEGV